MILVKEFTPDMVIQYSLVGLALLSAFGWIIYKMIKKSRSESSGGCCGCSLADACKKKNHGNITNLQQQHCGESNSADRRSH